MKKLAAAAATILLFLGGLASCQTQSTPTPLAAALPTSTITPITATPLPTAKPTITPVPALNSPSGPPLRILKMFAPADGWGLIYNALLVTHDGGTNWFSVPMAKGQVDELTNPFIVNMNTIYMVVPAPDGQMGQLYFTVNGGGTWQINPVPFINGQLEFIEQTGYFLETTRTSSSSMTAAIFVTNDNGVTWNRIFPGGNQDPGNAIPETGIKTGFSFINTNLGWLGTSGQPQKVVLYKTENGGRNWSPQEIPVPQNITSLITTCLPPVFFTDNQTDGVLPVDYVSMDTGDRNRVFYYTNDGGNTWTPGASVVDGEAYNFIDPKTGWAWGKRGIYFTTDGAKSWTLLPVAFGRSEHATALSFVDKNIGWLLTADAKNRVRIYTTRDGGNTWTAINP